MLRTNTKIDENIYKKLFFQPTKTNIVLEKRRVHQDRRKINTFLANDRRCGIADRRKNR